MLRVILKRAATTVLMAMFLLPCRKMYVRFGACMDGIDRFDSGAFRLKYAEAAALDPQARILLEQTHVSARSSVKLRDTHHVVTSPRVTRSDLVLFVLQLPAVRHAERSVT